MSQLELTLFGPPRITVDGRPQEIKRRKALALLAYLAVNRQSYSRDALAALLWPEADQARARAALRNALYDLNKTAIKAWLLVEGERVSLQTVSENEQRLQVDVEQFHELLAAVKRHDHPESESCAGCQEALTQAVTLHENEFLAGFTLPDAPDFDEWQYFQSDSLRDELAWALGRLTRLFVEQGQFGEAIPYARRLVALDPLQEAAQRSLMKLYAQAGQRSAALRQYELCRETLAAELGVEPAAETTALAGRIRSGAYQAEERQEAAAGVRPLETANAHNLPVEPTPFIGRDRELARLTSFVKKESTRLVTVVGPGGIGKTRLALAAAAEQVGKHNFPDGIFFVSLAPLSDPQEIVPAAAEAVGCLFQNDQRPPRQQLIDYVRQKSMLLLLDNLEHLLSGEHLHAADLVAELLQEAPRLKILTTSRERLNLYEEQLYPLQGLAVPDSSEKDPGTDYAAASLFLQSARRRLPDYEIAADDIPTLAEICRLVEGIPLALELAAPWLEIFSMGEIAGEIKGNIGFLETDMRNVPDRHRSMQAVFATSWQTLNGAEKSVYAQLSVFRGGFSPRAAQAVTGAAPRILTGLANKSLLHFNPEQKRVEIHELLRQYAAAQLEEPDAGAVRHRHAAHYCALLDDLTNDLKGEGFAAGMARIDDDHDNIVTAWHWAGEHGAADQLGHAYEALLLFYQWRERQLEGEQLCRLAVQGLRDRADSGDERHDLRVALLTWQSLFAQAASQQARAQAALDEAGRLLDGDAEHGRVEEATRAFYLLWRSNLATAERFDGQAVELNEESVALYQALHDEWGAAQALHSLSIKFVNLGRLQQALDLQKACMVLRLKTGNPREIARSHNVYGLAALHLGRFEEAEQHLNESIAINRRLGNQVALVEPLMILGISLLFNGKFEACVATNEESLRIHAQQGMVRELFVSHMSIMRAHLNLGLYQEVEEQGRVLLPRYRAMNDSWGLGFTLFNLGRLALVQGSLAEAERYLSESAEFFQGMAERNLYLGVLFNQAIVAQKQGDQQQFTAFLAQALPMALEGGPLNPMRFELVAMALWLLDEGQTERAVEFYTAALHSPYIANSVWFEDLAGRRITETAASMSPETVAAAQARGQARDLRETAEELLEELTS